MPELAEVEFNRKQWDPALGERVLRVHLRADKRIFLGTDGPALAAGLGKAVYLASEARGKQMLFRFSKGTWLAIHLGMTGRLRVEGRDYRPGRHDHLVLFLARRSLVFGDPRQFGRVRFHTGRAVPDWWKRLPPPVTGPHFTLAGMTAFLQRHRRLPIKAALLLQEGFPGIGNWMADEILWRTGLHPRNPAGRLRPRELGALWRAVRWVSRLALATVGADYTDLPRGWLFHERWSADGKCPRHRQPLERDQIGGRTTAWCARCQG